jgi:hypothetical protein
MQLIILASAISMGFVYPYEAPVLAETNPICGWLENVSDTGAFAPTLTVWNTNEHVEFWVELSTDLALPGYYQFYDAVLEKPETRSYRVISSFSRMEKVDSCQIQSPQPTLPLKVPVLALAFYPTDKNNPDFLDPVETGWVNIRIADMKKATKGMIDSGLAFINDSTRYHGYKNPNSPQYLDYFLLEMIEYSNPIPRGFPLNESEFRPNYHQILSDIDICDYVENRGVKEVWIYAYHTNTIVPDESKMSSKYGDISNALPKDEFLPQEFRLPRCNSFYVMYNFTYQPGGANAIGNTIHNRLHQIENVVFFSENLGYPVSEQNVVGSLFWNDFSVLWDRASLTGYRASCGNTHSPPNTTEGYDYDSRNYAENNCETWNPDDTLTSYVRANCEQWGCTDLGFYKWFMQNLPGYENGMNYQAKPLLNWWDAMVNFEHYIEQAGVPIPDGVSRTSSQNLPVFISPNPGETLKLGQTWTFKVEAITASQGFLWGFFQNGEMIWENFRDEGVLSTNEYTISSGSMIQKKFSPGPLTVEVRAFINNEWKEANRQTLTIE